jgi:hypothetical protein
MVEEMPGYFAAVDMAMARGAISDRMAQHLEREFFRRLRRTRRAEGYMLRKTD